MHGIDIIMKVENDIYDLLKTILNKNRLAFDSSNFSNYKTFLYFGNCVTKITGINPPIAVVLCTVRSTSLGKLVILWVFKEHQ